MPRKKPEIVGVAVGKKFEKYYGDGTTTTPWLENNDNLKRRIRDNQWRRWDGVEGTAEFHMEWVQEQTASLLSEERRGEFRPYGGKDGVQYFIHDEMTAAGDGYGFFKLEGTFELDPKDIIACMFDFGLTAEMDDTMVIMKNLQTFVGKDNFIVAAYWCNAPGFPFYYRDGVDLSSFQKDKDGVVWQVSCTVENQDLPPKNPYAINAVNRCWAYRLEPTANGHTKTTLICQVVLNGWIPKLLSNFMTCSVLADYMRTMEQVVKKNKKSGEHQKLLERLVIQNL